MEQTNPSPDKSAPTINVAMLVVLQAAVSGASLVVEIVAGRMLAPYVGMSLYTWTSVIAVVLAGFSVGHWAGGRLAEKNAVTALVATAAALAGAALTTAAAVFVLRWSAGPVITAMPSPVASIVVLTGLVFFLPSFFAGIPAPVLARIAVDADPKKAGRALGAMFAAGALGAIAGTLLAGFVFISRLGTVGTLTAVTLGYVVCALALLAAARAVPRAIAFMLLPVMAALGLAGGSLTLENPCSRESAYFCIRVLDSSPDPATPVRTMVLDHLAHGISARDYPDLMFTPHASMLELIARERMGQRPFSAFFIGGGTYSIPRAWARRGNVHSTIAEIDAAVTEIAESRFWFTPSKATTILHQDARVALRTGEQTYDVVIGDAFTDITVPQHLVTREFFELVRSRMAPNGVFLMNLIDHVDRLQALASVAETLRQVFPEVEVWAERAAPPPDGRVVFILVASDVASPFARLDGRNPDPFEAGRLSADAVASLIGTRGGQVLTDDFAPIDRLMALRE